MSLSATVRSATLIVVVVPWTVRFPVITKSASKVSLTLDLRNAVESKLSSVSALPPVDVTPVTPSFAENVKDGVWPVTESGTLVIKARI